MHQISFAAIHKVDSLPMQVSIKKGIRHSVARDDGKISQHVGCKMYIWYISSVLESSCGCCVCKTSILVTSDYQLLVV